MSRTNEVCARAGLAETHIILNRRQLRWTGHVVSMNDLRLPKQVLFGELANGTRQRGRPKLRFKDTPKNVTRHRGMLPGWGDTALDRIKWRVKVFEGAAACEEMRITYRKKARLRRKEPTQAAPTGLVGHIGNKPCKGNAGLQMHLRLGHR